MNTNLDAMLDYYALPAPMTSPGEYASLLQGLPRDIPALCRVVQGVMVHVFHLQRYGLELGPERKAEVQLRSAARILARTRALHDAPLVSPRPPEQRVVGNCRDFTVLLCTLLRHLGIPARARCGFATYFIPGHHEDHWVCEYWADEGRWALADAQLDGVQCAALGIDFDVYDVPRDRFLTGGVAWQRCRAGEADPATFGIFDMQGLGFVRGDLLRDLAALNKVELLPWDCWGVILAQEDPMTPEQLALCDRAAEQTLAGIAGFGEMRPFYEESAGVRVPPVIMSFEGMEPQPVDLEAAGLLPAPAPAA